MALKTYDFRKVAVLVSGVPITGFADGDAISVEFPESWTKQIGAGGAHTRSRNNDQSAQMTLTLQQTSLSNAFLSGLAAADELTGAPILGVLIKDLRGNDLLAAAQAYCSQRPGLTFGKDSGTREWVIQLVDVVGAALGTANS
jgi:hypothetical protein